jgi:hypothetical protein
VLHRSWQKHILLVDLRICQRRLAEAAMTPCLARGGMLEGKETQSDGGVFLDAESGVYLAIW